MIELKFWRDNAKEMMKKYNLEKVTFEEIKIIYKKEVKNV